MTTYRAEFKNYLGVTVGIYEGGASDVFGPTATEEQADKLAQAVCNKVASGNGCATIWKNGKQIATQNYLNI
jgi:hypothetical protein